MKKAFTIMLAALMLLGVMSGCATQTAAPAAAAASDGKDPYTGIAYSADTEYDYLYSSEITSMNYLTTSVSQNQKSLANFIDTLVEYDAHGNVVPCLAESWETSADGLQWTFHLRKDAKWFTCDGEEYAPLTANDFVYAARLVCNVDFDSDMPDMLTSYIANGSELYNKVIDDFTQLGVTATDDYTLVYTLKQPCAYFLTLLTYGCYLPINGQYYESLAGELEATEESANTNSFGTDRDKILYCGAYICSSWLPQEEYVWVKNDKYWDAEHVYITKISGKFNQQADSIAPEMFVRGELDACKVTTSILDDWLKGENKDLVHISRKGGTLRYMLFDFAPTFDDTAASEAYLAAVNNKNFRLAIAYGLDKKYCLSAYDPYNAEDRVSNLMVPEGFCSYEGKDYTQYGNLPELSKGLFDETKAKEYRDAAKAELEAAGVTLPIQVPMYYNPSDVNMDQCFQLLEKQLEELLGSDFVDVSVYAGPATNYIAEVRRAAIWGLFEAGWSPDYADPATYFEPFGYGWTFGMQESILGDEYKTGYIYTEEDYANAVIDDEALIGTPQFVFNSLVEAARAEKLDVNARYEKFAAAEEYAIKEGLLMPFQQFNDGYIASKLSIFDGEYSMAGICSYRYKGLHLLDKSYSMDEYNTALEAWKAEAAK